MQRSNLQILGLYGLTLSVSLITACGDPCLDDGRGKAGAVCDPGNADTNTETGTGTETDTQTSNTETAEGDGDETWCADEDMDGFGDPDSCQEVPAGETPPPGSVPQEQATDCDDVDPNTFPGAAELDDPLACMTDADDDGYGDDMPSNPNAVPGTDCDDNNDHAFPGAAENEDPSACMEDKDEDGWGDANPGGGATPGSDCADDDATIMSCDKWCQDMDMDMFGNPEVCVFVAPGGEVPAGYVQDDTDCLDTDPNAFPGAAELDDPDACMLDADGDGWGDSDTPPGVMMGRDCDDTDVTRVVCVDAIPGCVDTTQGLEAQLMSMASGGDGNYVYAWTPVETLNDPAIPNPTAIPDAITTYTINVTDGSMNMGSDEITVHLTDKPWILDGPGAECEEIEFLAEPDVPPVHSFSNGGTTVCTTSNSDPSAYVCPTVHQQSRITGTMVVNTASDDDMIGFVWGWQSASQFYLFQWKQLPQPWFGCMGSAGMTIKKFDATDVYVLDDFACDNDTANQTVLMTPDETTTSGWIDNREYGVELLYDLTQTEITITDLSDNSVVANFVVMDDSYPNGKFGTYDFSQEQACNGPWQSNCL
ncbi:hypothetical protein [Enhygromyxa salina]|uniref:TSP C-terminal domain-containing protein n=1 Tax=Enhygromyxa salina TaxID=215803 RepID=A0A2S9YMF3_9BACT|nr:hypothetical protein [Enhygromyxa salina]PRQ06262.1 hypothetical protein ENSA7_40390 [Enhygromyxa salina]